MSFNPNDHLSKIKTKQGIQDYLAVQWRLVWLREQAPDATIETELLQLDLDRQVAVFKAVVTHGSAIATGHGSENAKDFGDYIEKAETKAIGRALAALGFGTQFAPELEEGNRIVDSPVVKNAKPEQIAYPGTEHLTNGDGSPAFPAMPQAPTLADITGLFGKLYKPERFPSFKQMVLERTVADLDLTEDDRVKLWDKLVSIKKATKGNEQPAA
jgi:hypothetical protein